MASWIAVFLGCAVVTVLMPIAVLLAYAINFCITQIGSLAVRAFKKIKGDDYHKNV